MATENHYSCTDRSPDLLVVALCRYYQPYVDDADERIRYYTRKEKEATTRAEKDSWNKRAPV
jgi:hypothetical protein